MDFKRLQISFKDAFNGIRFVFNNEQNFRLQIYLAAIVLLLSYILKLRKSELIVILLLITLVLVLELLNSVVEKFSDLLKPRLSYQIHIIKDVMAGMVFFASLMSAIIGLIIFVPYLIEMFSF